MNLGKLSEQVETEYLESGADLKDIVRDAFKQVWAEAFRQGKASSSPKSKRAKKKKRDYRPLYQKDGVKHVGSWYSGNGGRHQSDVAKIRACPPSAPPHTRAENR